MFNLEGFQIPAILLTYLLTNMITAYITLLLLSRLDTALAIFLLPDELARASITLFVLSHPFTISAIRVLTRPLTTSMLLYTLVPIVIGVCVRVIFQISKGDTEERKNYIQSSFVASGTLSHRMVTWLGPSGRAHLLGIRFHSEWRHPDCTVMRWYNDQSASSRNFRTVEHRRDVNGPFYHEFLLFRLADGAICRLERVGEGSQADAIRYTGCTANDLIQWFTREDYAELESEHPSVLISEVGFPFEYDILDVLAICYSIHNTKACKVYTLQRYNCYFLCLTVLAVLTRRAASWETAITDRVWDLALDCELTRLSSLPARELKETLMLRMYAMLEPSNPHCSKTLLEELRLHIYSGSQIGREMQGAASLALWVSPWESEILIESIASCVHPLVTNANFRPIRLRDLLRASVHNLGQLTASNEAVAEFYNKEMFKQLHRIVMCDTQVLSDRCRMTEIEQPTPLIIQISCRMLQFVLLVSSAVIQPASMPNVHDDLWRSLGIDMETSRSHLSKRLALMKHISGYLGYAGTLAILKGDEYRKMMETAVELSLKNRYGPTTISMLDTLESKDMLEQEANVKLVFARMLGMDEDYRTEYSFVLPTLMSTLKTIFQGQPAHISVKAWENSSAVPEISGTLEFQQRYIQPRIQAHAERVALHQLAAGPLVYADINNTMTAVWKSLPPGFGGAGGTSLVSSQAGDT